jgi:hypothetical protein
MEPGVLKGTPLGALGTEAIVRLGTFSIQGPSMALRALADACNDAALLAERYAADPDGYNERERQVREQDQ